MTYRDTFDTCPRCGVSLVDARSARSCPTCKGLWIEEPIVSEMVLEMLPPQPYGRLVLAVLEHTGDPLPCPTCKEPMQATEIHGILLDRCAKQHGIWFDGEELQVALQRVADPARTPPLGAMRPHDAASDDAAAAGDDAPASRNVVAAPVAPTPSELRFVIHEPGEPVRDVVVAKPVARIGRVRTAEVRLTDPRVQRMHAIIETRPGGATIVDLGSDDTFVDGQPIRKAHVGSGDRITVGATTIDLMLVFK